MTATVVTKTTTITAKATNKPTNRHTKAISSNCIKELTKNEELLRFHRCLDRAYVMRIHFNR